MLAVLGSVAVILVPVLVFVGLLVFHEAGPAEKFQAEVTRTWVRRYDRHVVICWVEVRRDGVKHAYRCSPSQFNKAQVGSRVGVQLKSGEIEFLQPLERDLPG
ncbi:MAG TPA: hypothetical protein VK464_15015 [Symbiobacteriaceae bacterium]|nr:hypothetical protein [Symbiobacteriaceae bacterium]